MPSAFDNLAVRYMTRLMADFSLTAEQAAGIVGNLGAESGLLAINERNPIVPGSRGGWGIMQWTGPRRRQAEKWWRDNGFSDPTTFDAQYGFMAHELRTTEAKSLRMVRLTKTAKAAAETFMKHNLRPGIPHTAKRIILAERALALYRAKLPSPIPDPVRMPSPTLPDPKPPSATRRYQGLGIAALAIVGGMIVKKLFPGQEGTWEAFIVDWGPELVAGLGLSWSWLGQRWAYAPVTGTPLADEIEAAKAQLAELQANCARIENDHEEAEERAGEPIEVEKLPFHEVLRIKADIEELWERLRMPAPQAALPAPEPRE